MALLKTNELDSRVTAPFTTGVMNKKVVPGYFRDCDYLLLFFVNREFHKLFFVFRAQIIVRAPR